jgi:predicted phosphohydrolase
LNTPKVPEGDVLLHAGDLSLRGTLPEIVPQLEWLSSLSHPYKIFIAGNHDFFFEDYPGQVATLLGKFPDLIYLQDSEVRVGGIKIWGSPWQPEFNNWAFNLERGEPLREKWALIPEDTDILITHGPPYGILDYANFSAEHCGCENLFERIVSIRPKVHLFGHIHEGAGVLNQEATTYINASVLDDEYAPNKQNIYCFDL